MFQPAKQTRTRNPQLLGGLRFVAVGALQRQLQQPPLDFLQRLIQGGQLGVGLLGGGRRRARAAYPLGKFA